MGESALQAAFRQLTVWDIWRDANLGYTMHKNAKGFGEDGLHLSPLRADSKPSFSVGQDGKVFNDFSSDEIGGGVWDFCKLAFDLTTKAEISKKLIAVAGLEHLDKGEAPSRRDLDRLKSKRRHEQAKRTADRVSAAWSWPEEAGVREYLPWPNVVSSRWFSGVRICREAASPFDYLVRWRGWPEELCEKLVECGLLSYPKNKYVEDVAGPHNRAMAFKVAVPDFTSQTLKPLGYHQVSRSASTGQSFWGFFPNVPHEPKGEYMKALAILKMSVPAMPFAVGNAFDADRVAILEGQWDAATYHWVNGGFEEGSRLLTLGLRGVSSWRLALSVWRPALEGVPITIIPDNDGAGEALYVRKKKQGLEQPSMADILEMVAETVSVSQIPTGLTFGKDSKPVKDFNDYYRYKRELKEW